MKTIDYILIGIIVIVVIAIVLFKDQIKAFANIPMATKPTSNSQPPAVLDKNKNLYKGVTGAEVKELQRLLAVTADGDFGPITENALKARKGVLQTTLNIYMSLPDLLTEEFSNGADGSWSEDGVFSYDTGGGMFQGAISGAINWITG